MVNSLEKFLSGPVSLPYPLDFTHRTLLRAGYITGVDPVVFDDGTQGPSHWAITDAGRLAYQQAKQEAKEKADQKRQQRFENKVAVASVLVGAVSFILGLLVEHYASLLNIITAFLH